SPPEAPAPRSAAAATIADASIRIRIEETIERRTRAHIALGMRIACAIDRSVVNCRGVKEILGAKATRGIHRAIECHVEIDIEFLARTQVEGQPSLRPSS